MNKTFAENSFIKILDLKDVFCKQKMQSSRKLDFFVMPG